MAEENKLLAAVQADLLKKSDMVSSTVTNIEETIAKSIGGIERGQELSAERIESQFGRERAFQAEQFVQQRTSVLEAQRGFAVNAAALQQLDERTEKSLRDLDQRKQELILAGESAAAGQISELQLKSLTFKLDAEQRAFNNMISAGTLGIQAQNLKDTQARFIADQDLKKAQFDFAQDKAIADIAGQFGVTVGTGETLQSIINKVQPKASAEQKARLAKLQKDSTKEATDINTESQITDLIVNQGLNPTQAVLQTFADLKAVGVDVSPEDFNTAISRAQEIFDAFKIEEDRANAEVDKGGIVGSIFDFFSSRAQEAGGTEGGRRKATPFLREERPQFQSLGGGAGNAALEDLNTFTSNLFQL